MTGTGGWAYFSATRYMLGIKPQFDHLQIDPCVPSDWKEFKVTREFRGAVYEITVLNPDSVMKGVTRMYLDGAETNVIPVCDAGSRHEVTVIMGR